MESFCAQLLGTVAMRPYVFAFLFAYFLGCSLHMGIKRAVAFCMAGYFIALLSEYSSIHNGIPYGLYYYIETTKGKELWVAGVPFMDSLSYVFLAYASYSVALMVICPLLYSKGTVYLLETAEIRRSSRARGLGALLLVYLDIIIDPVALRGDKWFLGRIYGYPGGGDYFGVPVSNFAGWFAIGFLMLYALQKIDEGFYRGKIGDYAGYKYPWRYMVGPLLYISVLVFNLSVTFAVGEYTLGWAGIFIVLLPAVLIAMKIRGGLEAGYDDKALEAHLRDFPQAVIPGEDITTEDTEREVKM